MCVCGVRTIDDEIDALDIYIHVIIVSTSLVWLFHFGNIFQHISSNQLSYSMSNGCVKNREREIARSRTSFNDFIPIVVIVWNDEEEKMYVWIVFRLLEWFCMKLVHCVKQSNHKEISVPFHKIQDFFSLFFFFSSYIQCFSYIIYRYSNCALVPGCLLKFSAYVSD